MIFRRETLEEQRQKEFERKCRQATLDVINRGSATDKKSHGESMVSAPWPYETILSVKGVSTNRLRPSIFYWGALISLIAGIVLVSNEIQILAGGFLVLTLAPCLLLYPLIRFLFGGKDSVGAAITTVVVEEVLKREIIKAAEKGSKSKW